MDEEPHARLSLDDLYLLTKLWRERARSGDATTCRVADALDSVLKRRIREARDRQRAVERGRDVRGRKP